MKTFVKLIAILAVYILLCGLFYIFGAFYSVSFDPVKWYEGCRVFVVLAWVIITVALVAAGLDYLNKK